MAIGQIQIRTQPAQLGYDLGPGQYDILQPRPTVEIKQPKADLRIEQPRGQLTIDSSRAWDALGVGGNMQMMLRIYSQAPQIARQGIAKIVDAGNRMSEITNKNDAFAELAQGWNDVHFTEFDTMGDASVANVDVRYQQGDLVIEAQPRPVEWNAQVNPPQVSYTKGPKEIYMVDYGKVEITPPQIDITV